MQEVCVYGKQGCEDTRQARAHLDLLGVPYRYVDLGRDSQAEAWVRAHNGGRLLTPTVEVGQRILAAPGDAELERELRGAGAMR
jgi:glutaredoxin